jgi:hypothetical protein
MVEHDHYLGVLVQGGGVVHTEVAEVDGIVASVFFSSGPTDASPEDLILFAGMALLGEEDFHDQFPVLAPRSLLEQFKLARVDAHANGRQYSLFWQQEDVVGDVDAEGAVEEGGKLFCARRSLFALKGLTAGLLDRDVDLGVEDCVVFHVHLL